MIKSGEGMTKTYNRFHDRYDKDPEVIRLRDLHDEMDKAVLEEYGWDDIRMRCEFLPDHGIDQGSSVQRHWRYRWPDHVRDEVLGRLIELNAQRVKEERANQDSEQPKRDTPYKDQHASELIPHSNEPPVVDPPTLFAERDE